MGTAGLRPQAHAWVKMNDKNLCWIVMNVSSVYSYNHNHHHNTSDETEEPKEDAEGGQALLKKEDPVAGTVGELKYWNGEMEFEKKRKR